MFISVTATLALALLAMAPGLLLMRGQLQRPGALSAAMAASLTVVMTLTALIGIASHAVFGATLPVLIIVPVAVLSCAVAYRVRANIAVPAMPAPFEWQGLAIGIIFLCFGLFVQWLAVRPGEDGALLVHGWFNADWFKHLGHVSAIGNHGVPALDNFNQADLLHYYWLSYVLPGVGVAIGNDSWAALAAANSVFVLLFGPILYGIIRSAGISRNIAFVVGLIALFVSAPISVLFQLLFGIGFEGISNFPSAPKAPALLTLPMYVPQHLLTLIVLLGWYLLRDERRLKWLALAALAPAMTISVLLGACVLLAYGLYRLWEGRLKTVPELTAMVVLSGLFVVVFQVVQIGNVDSAIESPLLVNERPDLPLVQRIIDSVSLIVGNVGIPFLVALVGLFYWKPKEPSELQSKMFAIALILAAVLAAIGAEIALTERLAIETRIRAVNLPGVANAIVGAVLLQMLWQAGGQRRLVGALAVAALVLIALPSAYFRTAWHGRMGDIYTTTISRDDRAVLGVMREQTARDAVVLQYPEPPILAPTRGDDAWAAIIGQRAVTASLRATDYPIAKPRIEAAERFFSGQEQGIAQEVDLVYLSRALHSDSYDSLKQQMSGDAEFEELACYADACLFQRRVSSNQ